MYPSKYGPKPSPASRNIKKVEVASPIRFEGVTLTAIAWVHDCILPNPRPIRTPANNKVVPV